MERRFLFALFMPIALIIILLFIIYKPFHSTSQSQDFLFSLTREPMCANGKYAVDKQKITWQENKNKNFICKKISVPQLYRYNVARNQSESVSFRTAKNWMLDASPTSSQGFAVVNTDMQEGPFGDIFSFRSRENYYLTGPGTGELVNFPPEQNHQFREFKFLGWIQS